MTGLAAVETAIGLAVVTLRFLNRAPAAVVNPQRDSVFNIGRMSTITCVNFMVAI